MNTQTLTARPDFLKYLEISARRAIKDYTALGGDNRTREYAGGMPRIDFEDIAQAGALWVLKGERELVRGQGNEWTRAITPVAYDIATREVSHCTLAGEGVWSLRALAKIAAKAGLRACGLRVDRLESVTKFEGVSLETLQEVDPALDFQAVAQTVALDPMAEVLSTLANTYALHMENGANTRTAQAHAKSEAVAEYRKHYGANVTPRKALADIREALKGGAVTL